MKNGKSNVNTNAVEARDRAAAKVAKVGVNNTKQSKAAQAQFGQAVQRVQLNRAVNTWMKNNGS